MGVGIFRWYRNQVSNSSASESAAFSEPASTAKVDTVDVQEVIRESKVVRRGRPKKVQVK